MKRCVIVVLVGLILLAAGPARAADLFTPVLSVGGADAVICQVLNISSGTLPGVTIELNVHGGPSGAPLVVDIGPGEVQTLTEGSPSGPVYCRAAGVSKTKGRLILCLRDPDGGCITSAIGR